jgi:plasmid stabilization system protein ParE
VLALAPVPYRIFYRVSGDRDVIVLRVLHAARQP